ncbi:hypothetical protein [Melittangium boletus]|uniref:hypothetical protein n=1 Tax=Melittangium boletus TaxID=83453 RepID=UPI000BB2D505|nr:hypothetical protein [Melittangium boletus]
MERWGKAGRAAPSSRRPRCIGHCSTCSRRQPLEGSNGLGQLGDGTTTKRDSRAGAWSDGTTWAWGYNSDGQIGDGGPALYATTPIRSLLY